MNIEGLKEEIIEIVKQKKLTKEELRKALNIKGETNQEIFKEALDQLTKENQIILNEKGFYNISLDENNLIKGQIYIDKAGKGHFIGEKNGQKIRFLITGKYLNGALDGDFVLVKDRGLKRGYDCKLGAVDQVLQRKSYPKMFVYEGSGLFSLYSNTLDIYLNLPPQDCRGLVKGTLILAWVDEEPTDKNIYEGKLCEVCGHIDDPETLTLAIGYKYGFQNTFSDKAINEANKMPHSVTNEDIVTRKDLREEKIFTIDGADTKDIDDSIGITKDGENYILKVNIADVSHYIKKGSFLDKEAYYRGNSVYPADTVLPMFPHTISNGICSLNPNTDRLTITGEITLNKDFEVIDFKMYESVINSKKQMTYEKVNEVLKGKKVTGYEDFEDDLRLLNKIAKKLAKERRKNGALDFFSKENKIKTDKEGNIIDIKIVEKKDAEELIETLMILMNTEVATLLDTWGYQIVYRVHPEPNIKGLLIVLEELKAQNIKNDYIDIVINDLNQGLKGKKVNPKSIQLFLNSIKNEEYYETISNLVLRSMKRAYYSENNIGHFGLAMDNYIHFTSPIRRYADLTNHRIAKQIMKYDQNPTIETYNEILEELKQMETELKEICMHISKKEALADKVEEEVLKVKQFENFESHLEDYEGPIKAKILNISKTGIIAKIDDIYEIIIPAENLRLSGFKYRKESRSFENKNEKIKLNDEIYVFNPEVFKGKNLITYTEVSKDPNNLIKEIEKRRYIKTKKIHI